MEYYWYRDSFLQSLRTASKLGDHGGVSFLTYQTEDSLSVLVKSFGRWD